MELGIIAVMPRRPRIFFPGAFYHVLLRGNGGQDIFLDEKDRRYFFRLVGEGQEKFGHRIHAFCLMPNHVHLALQMPEAPLSRIMQNLSQRYTGWVNFRQSRRGHVFQGRYKALLIEAEAYLLELVRYIHLNPVRAGIAQTPDHYPWSSHPAYMGQKNISWLTTDFVLGQFSSRRSMAYKKYHEFIRGGLSGGRREEFHRGTREGQVLGSDHFYEEVLSRKGEQKTSRVTIDQIVEAVCRSYSIGPEELATASRRHDLSEARGMISWIVRETRHLPMTGLCHRLHRDLSSLSVGARRVEERAKRDPKLMEKMKKLKEKF